MMEDKNFSQNSILLPPEMAGGYLVTGGSAKERKNWAVRAIQRVNCLQSNEDSRPCGLCEDCQKIAAGSYADLLLVEALGSQIKIEQIRGLKQELGLTQFSAKVRAVLIVDSEKLNIVAQNALLKTLEEPPSRTIFILMTENPMNLLPTVRSRCKKIALPTPFGQNYFDSPIFSEHESILSELLSWFKAGNELAAMGQLEKDLENSERFQLKLFLLALALGDAYRQSSGIQVPMQGLSASVFSLLAQQTYEEFIDCLALKRTRSQLWRLFTLLLHISERIDKNDNMCLKWEELFFEMSA